MGEAGRKRIKEVYAWRVVGQQYRELWSELSERRSSAHLHGNVQPWPTAHAARLFAAHAGAPPSAGPWWLEGKGTDPNLLTDNMQSCFLQQLIPIRSLASLADKLQVKREAGGQWLETDDLYELYGQCGIHAREWNRVTNLLEKLAIVSAARQ